MSDLGSHSDVNVRSRRYFIAQTVGTCWCCRGTTRLLALGLSPEHETLVLGSGLEGDDAGRDSWEGSFCNVLLFYIEYLPDAVQRRLKEFSPFYRFAYSTSTLGSYWANHCERCGLMFEDHELLCEPDGAFLPTSHASAIAIQLWWIDEPIEAAAAGYSLEPQFLDPCPGPERETAWPSIS